MLQKHMSFRLRSRAALSTTLYQLIEPIRRATASTSPKRCAGGLQLTWLWRPAPFIPAGRAGGWPPFCIARERAVWSGVQIVSRGVV